MPSPNEITVSRLNRRIGLPDCPVLIDVCLDEDFNAAPVLIPTSCRHPFTDIESLAPEHSGRPVVVICQKGLKISQGAAALLRSHGVRAEYLQGGIFAWRNAGLPLIPAAKIPASANRRHSLWVTRHRPKIDRIACPWLIRRFVDPGARFLFVSPSEVLRVADRYDATPFDVEDVAFSHKGDACSFDTMLDVFGLKTEPLERLAAIVRAADKARPEPVTRLVPQADGLLAASLGLSRMYKDDQEQLEAGMMLYDAFYRWARDAFRETHAWPHTGGQTGGANPGTKPEGSVAEDVTS